MKLVSNDFIRTIVNGIRLFVLNARQDLKEYVDEKHVSSMSYTDKEVKSVLAYADDKIKSSVADWSENDPSSVNYVQNRTHYMVEETHIGSLLFTATGSNTMSYTYVAEDQDIFTGINELCGKGEIIKAIIDGHSVMFSATFDRGNFTFSGSLSGSFNWNVGQVWNATINAGEISLTNGNNYMVDFFDTVPKYHCLDVKFLSKGVFTTEHAPIQYGNVENAAVVGEGTIASSKCAFAEGEGTTASGTGSHAEGCYTVSSYIASHAEGNETIASSASSHAEGNKTIASGAFSHAEGDKTTAKGERSHTEGIGTIANQSDMSVSGAYNAYDDLPDFAIYINGTINRDLNVKYYIASEYSFDEESGQFTLIDPVRKTISDFGVDDSIGKYFMYSLSSSLMYHVISKSSDSVIAEEFGRVKTSSIHGPYAHIIGNGTSEEDRSNAHTLDWDGNAWFAGEVYVGGSEQGEGIALAHKPKCVAVVLSASEWDETDKTQTVTVVGVSLDEASQIIHPCPSSSSASAYRDADILCTGQATDSLTFTAQTIPSDDLTVYVTIQEVDT